MAETKRLPRRSEGDPAFQWRTSDIYPTDEAFLQALDTLKTRIGDLAALKGTLGTADGLLSALCLFEQTGDLAGDIGSYAALKSDEDTKNATYQGYLGQVTAVLAEMGAATAFFVPEILDKAEEISHFVDTVPALQHYRKYLDDILHQRPHVLPEREEHLMSLMAEMSGSAEEIFSMLSDADMEFGTITDADGEPVQLTHGRYIHFLESTDRRVRREAFEALYKVYAAHSNTLAAILLAHERKNKFAKQARGYESCLAMCLYGNRIPTEVYHSLIEAVHEAHPSFYRYMALRKKALGLEELHMYDLYVPICENPYQKVSYDEAWEMVIEALKPLGEEYAVLLQKARTEGWIDVYENEGKRSGAYSNGTPTCHPYLLLNHQDNLESAFTLAHELGHAMHSYLTNHTQPPIYRGYSIFVAEVASTVNEALLLRYLQKEAGEDQKKLAYLTNHALEQFRATLFRQTMFAEFELKTHELVEQGLPLTPEVLDGLYGELCAAYFGDGVVQDALIRKEWSRIPHFYYDFYVYQYATGFASAQAIAGRILEQGGVEDYLRFLSAGDSLTPLEALKVAGVDLSTPQPVREALWQFDRLVEQMEGLV
ncbi:MAG: oligoendopeptidase F [Clostridia bacterium]|nr:oligoendopeptidase F [Clostridia bacterium]